MQKTPAMVATEFKNSTQVALGARWRYGSRTILELDEEIRLWDPEFKGMDLAEWQSEISKDFNRLGWKKITSDMLEFRRDGISARVDIKPSHGGMRRFYPSIEFSENDE